MNILFFFTGVGAKIYLNDYLNPFTLTFKNPKTLQMFNIIVLYHYVMAFLVGVIIFTFIFIFLSFFRTYFFFNYKTYYQPQEFCSFGEFLAYFRSNLFNFRFSHAYENFISYIRISIIRQKNKHLAFYKKDIKSSLTDQITHAPLLEFLWVIFPALILVAIAYPSIILLYYNEAYVEPVFNITVIGNQWFWTYEYNDFNLIKLFKRHISSDKTFFQNIRGTYLHMLGLSSFSHRAHLRRDFNATNEILNSLPQRLTVDCNMIIAKDPKFLRLLTTDQCLVIPAKTPIRFLITSSDVIHSWAIPSYGIKLDAVPGRINQQILTVPLMGTSWGQCSELCGVNHAFMPIEIKVLAFSDFLYFIQLKVKEILLPHLTAYYKTKIDFLRKYTLRAYHFLYFVRVVVWPPREDRPVWMINKEMHWDLSCWYSPDYLNFDKTFYFIFMGENAAWSKKQKLLGDAVRYARRMYFVKTSLKYNLPAYYIFRWKFFLFSWSDLALIKKPPFRTLYNVFYKLTDYPIWERQQQRIKDKARARRMMLMYRTVLHIIDTCDLRQYFFKKKKFTT